MNSSIFEEEFSKRYKGTYLKLSQTGSGKEYVISNEVAVLKAVVIAWPGERRETFSIPE